jgi:hypothetical protein
MQVTVGIITVVQEGRFRLASEDGRSLLLTLAAAAPHEPQDVQALQAEGVRVGVVHEDAPGRASGVAHEIRPEPAP